MSRFGTTLLALIAVITTVAILWYTNRAVLPRKVARAEAEAEAQKGGYKLTNLEEILQRLTQDPSELLIVDTREKWEYATGHIKGAMHFPVGPGWWSQWRNKRTIQTVLGPDKNRFIVFY